MRRRILDDAEASDRTDADSAPPGRCPQGDRLTGALVSTFFDRDRDRSPTFTAPAPVEQKSTDARGEASLKLEIGGHLDGVGVYAIRPEPGQDSAARRRAQRHTRGSRQAGDDHDVPGLSRPFPGGVPGLPRGGVEIQCRAGRPELLAGGLREARHWRRSRAPSSPTRRAASSSSFCPPADYTLMIYGSDVKSVDRPIEIAPGHRVRSLGVVDLVPQRRGTAGCLSATIITGSSRILRPSSTDDADGKKVLLRRVQWLPR